LKKGGNDVKKNKKTHRNEQFAVILTSGERFIDRILESRDRFYRFQAKGRVLRRNIRSVSTFRGDSP
jgi:hypothetical protein